MEKENRIKTNILEETHKKVKGFAGLKGIDIPEAYDLLVAEGLKALNFQLPRS